MRFRYDFVNGHETIEVDEEWMAVLREFDRLEGNSDRRHRYHNIHYHAIEYEPDFMGKEDEGITELLDGTPAFEYATEHLIPKYREILYRRAYKGEKYKDIAKDYGVTDTCIFHIYRRASERFRKYYEEGYWLFSRENKNSSAVPKVKKIPFGLTYAQVMAIRAYRQDYKSIDEIAKLLDVPKNRVRSCLHENPVLETKCPFCGSLISQPVYGKMRIFCNSACYYKWFRCKGSGENKYSIVQTRTKLTDEEKQVLDFYRYYYVPLYRISKITGISEQRVSSYFYSNPLPYTLCKNCKTQVPGEVGKRTSMYCSKKCRDVYGENMKKARKKMKGQRLESIVPMPEQLYYAIALRKLNYTMRQIECLSGLSQSKVTDLFRFHNITYKCKYCKENFVPKTVTQIYCSDECKNKAKSKKSRRKYKESKNGRKKKNDESSNRDCDID